MSGAPKYIDAVQMQLRLPRELKGKLQARSQESATSVNQIIVDYIESGLATAMLNPSTPGVVVTRTMTHEEAAQLRSILPEPSSTSLWFNQLAILKMLPKTMQGQMFMAIIHASGAEMSLPEGFRDMDQADKAAWLDVNCPLGGE